MAKVTGPLMSMSASGKLGKAIVFFPWKGISVVREYLKPSNPQTGAQGDVRHVLGGLGRAGSTVDKLSLYAEYSRAVTPTGQTWLSKFVQYSIDTYMPNATQFEVMWTEATSHAEWSIGFNDVAVAEGMVDFFVPYRLTSNYFLAGLQLYMLAKYATQQYLLDNTKFNSAPYTKALATWVKADVELMVADFAAL